MQRIGFAQQEQERYFRFWNWETSWMYTHKKKSKLLLIKSLFGCMCILAGWWWYSTLFFSSLPSLQWLVQCKMVVSLWKISRYTCKTLNKHKYQIEPNIQNFSIAEFSWNNQHDGHQAPQNKCKIAITKKNQHCFENDTKQSFVVKLWFSLTLSMTTKCAIFSWFSI